MTARVPDHAALPVEQLRITPPTPIDPIEFWTCDDDPDRLSITEFEEAVIEHVDKWAPAKDLEALLRVTIAPLTVYGHSRAEVTDEFLDGEAEELVERLTERLNEDEWGDPDGNHDVFSEKGQELLAAKFAVALREVRHHIVPWHCKVTKTVVIEADELVAMVRAQCPEWLAKAQR